jgi:hypothetical protein
MSELKLVSRPNRPGRPSRPSLRRAREVAFALCTVWLVIQNCVLLAFVPWTQLPKVTTMLAALLKAAVLVLGPMWVIGSAAVLGWAFMTSLARDGNGAAAEQNWEMDHGRAR